MWIRLKSCHVTRTFSKFFPDKPGGAPKRQFPFPQHSTPRMVRKSHWPFFLERTKSLPGPAEVIMSIATKILSLRRGQSSSVKRLLAALDWQKAAQDNEHFLSRGYAVNETADIVLLNVAAHAAEALSEPPTIRRPRRTVLSSRGKRRRSDPSQLHQR